MERSCIQSQLACVRGCLPACPSLGTSLVAPIQVVFGRQVVTDLVFGGLGALYRSAQHT